MSGIIRALVLCMLGLALQAAVVRAQTYPSRPITIVLGFTPGAASDTAARLIGTPLSVALGQPVVIDTRAGGAGNPAAGHVARAQPDGYTLMVGVDSVMTSNVHLFKNLPFDPVRDFAPIQNVGANIICLAVNAELPVKSVPELIAYAKANPGKVSFGSSGVGTPHHLGGVLLNQMAGTDLVHVPYRGGGPAANDLIAGHIQAAFLSLSSAAPHASSGRIRILAVVEKNRYGAMPNVPTIGEFVPGFEMNSWIAIFGPAGIPEPVVTRLNAEIGKIIRTDAVKEKLAALGLAVEPTTPAELGAIVQRGLEQRGQLVKAAGIQPE
jgi:tripartite-type tricarboxylate transporter receptor subunit TctC